MGVGVWVLEMIMENGVANDVGNDVVRCNMWALV